MSDLQVRGPLWGTTGSTSPFTASRSGAQRVTDAHARYAETALNNNVFTMSVAAGGPTAYVGAAGGTPLLCVHNPTGSGKNFVPLAVCVALRVAGSAAGQTGLAVWGGPSVLPTQATTTTPTSALSLTASGSAARGWTNVALTSSTAVGLLVPLYTYYWATAAAAFAAPGFFDLAGLFVVSPGNQMNVGFTTVPTSLTADVSIFWEEIPYLP